MAEVFDKQDAPTMIAICNEAGEAWARALMVKLVSNFAEFYSTNNTMSDYQIADTVDLMLEEYPHYKLDDYKLFFKMAKKGYFGQIFGRIDGEVVLSWLKKYDEQRCIEAQNMAIKEKEKIHKNGIHVFKVVDQFGNEIVKRKGNVIIDYGDRIVRKRLDQVQEVDGSEFKQLNLF